MKNYCTGIMTCSDPCSDGIKRPCKAIVEYKREMRQFCTVRKIHLIIQQHPRPYGCFDGDLRKTLLPLQGHPLTKKERTKYFAQLL